jgi:Putative beta-barrel porin 2
MNTRLSIAAVLLGLLPAAANAQTQGSDPLENATIRVGPVGINPTIVVRDIGVDNNVFNDHSDPKSDFTFTLTPRAEVLFRPRRLKVTYTTAVDYVYFQKYTSERGTNQSSQVRFDVDLGHLRPFASVGGTNTRERYNQEIDARARHSDRTYGAGVALQIASRTTITVAARRTTTDFEEGSTFRGEDLARAFNNRLDAFDGTFGLQLTPITSFSLVVTEERQRFDLDPDRDSDTTRITPTFTFSPGGLLNGSAAIGYRHFNGRSSALPDFSGVVAIVNIGATILGRHRLDTSFARDLRYSYDTDTPYYLATGGTAVWTTQLSGRFDVKATGTRQQLDYHRSITGPTTVPDDVYTSYGGGVGYRVRQRLRVGINGDWSHRKSDRSADRAFHNHRVFATVTWGTLQ